MRKPRLGLAAVGATVALLTGCGSLSPGTAVSVGDETISVSEVDEVTDEYCEAIEGQLEGNNQVVPNRYFRSGIAGQLAMRSIGEQLAAEYDAEPGRVYDRQVASLRSSVQLLPEEVRDAVVQVETAAAYVESIQASVGERLLAQEGDFDAEYSATVERGQQEFRDWIEENGVEFDPQLRLEMVDGVPVPLDSSVSYPFSEAAQQGVADSPDQAYARGLPATQRCG